MTLTQTLRGAELGESSGFEGVVRDPSQDTFYIASLVRSARNSPTSSEKKFPPTCMYTSLSDRTM